jgi:hypothetical protein
MPKCLYIFPLGIFSILSLTSLQPFLWRLAHSPTPLAKHLHKDKNLFYEYYRKVEREESEDNILSHLEQTSALAGALVGIIFEGFLDKYLMLPTILGKFGIAQAEEVYDK